MRTHILHILSSGQKKTGPRQIKCHINKKRCIFYYNLSNIYKLFFFVKKSARKTPAHE